MQVKQCLFGFLCIDLNNWDQILCLYGRHKDTIYYWFCLLNASEKKHSPENGQTQELDQKRVEKYAQRKKLKNL